MLKSIKRLIGTPPINPYLFYSGKFSGYLLWIWFIAACFTQSTDTVTEVAGVALSSVGLLILIISSSQLGDATRLGLPQDDTKLQTGGCYAISRNPLYVALSLFSLASMLYLMHWWAVCLGVYSIIIHHYIILGEERFLEKRFGRTYREYQKRVRRYL